MAEELLPNQLAVLDEVLGWNEDGERVFPLPDWPPDLAATIQVKLETRIGEAAARFDEPHRPLTVSKWEISSVIKCEGLYLAPADFSWTVPRARGKVVHRAIQISLAGRRADSAPQELVDFAIDAMSEGEDELAGFLRELSPSDLAELTSASTAAVTAFKADWPRITPSMIPRVEARVSVPLCNDRVKLKGQYDLALGKPGLASVVVDLKTGDSYPEHSDELRYYALLETLKTKVPPYRVSTYFLDGGYHRTQDVTLDTLESAVRRTSDAVCRISEVWHRVRDPVLTPGPHCNFCPARPDCPTGSAWLQENREGRPGGPSGAYPESRVERT